MTIHEMISLNASGDFEVEITGTSHARTALIFVHGFGVKRDSRGMFTEIEASLANTMLSVRAEFSEVFPDSCNALAFSIQRQRLGIITDYVQDKLNIDKFIYIGHSQGCLTIGLEQPRDSQIILLAPPVESPFEAFIRTPGWCQRGSQLDIQGYSRLQRSDLVINVNPIFWDEFKQIDAKSTYSILNQQNEVTMIFGGNDDVLGKQAYLPEIKAYTIEDADHDFTGCSRNELLRIIAQLIRDNTTK